MAPLRTQGLLYALERVEECLEASEDVAAVSRFQFFAEDFEHELQRFGSCLESLPLTDATAMLKAMLQVVLDVFVVMDRRYAIMNRHYHVDFLGQSSDGFHRLMCNRSEYVVGLLLDRQVWFPTNARCTVQKFIPQGSTSGCVFGCRDTVLVESVSCGHFLCWPCFGKRIREATGQELVCCGRHRPNGISPYRITEDRESRALTSVWDSQLLSQMPSQNSPLPSQMTERPNLTRADQAFLDDLLHAETAEPNSLLSLCSMLQTATARSLTSLRPSTSRASVHFHDEEFNIPPSESGLGIRKPESLSKGLSLDDLPQKSRPGLLPTPHKYRSATSLSKHC